MKKKLDAFRGRLSAAQVAGGMNAASRNAKRLVEDATLLMESSRFPSACALAILSIEEAGKLSILRSIALATSDADAAEAWKEYRSHSAKNAAWILPQLVAAGARKLDDLMPIFDQSSDHPFVLDQVKQIAFYTDCLGKAHWSEPNAVVDQSLAQMLVGVATILAREGTHSEMEIDLWIEHVGPVWRKDPTWMKQAVVNWYSSMQRHGLAPDGPNQMEEFIRNGIPTPEA